MRQPRLHDHLSDAQGRALNFSDLMIKWAVYRQHKASIRSATIVSAHTVEAWRALWLGLGLVGSAAWFCSSWQSRHLCQPIPKRELTLARRRATRRTRVGLEAARATPKRARHRQAIQSRHFKVRLMGQFQARLGWRKIILWQPRLSRAVATAVDVSATGWRTRQ